MHLRAAGRLGRRISVDAILLQQLLVHVGAAVVADDHVGGVHVQVQHAFAVQVLERPRDLQRHLHHQELLLHAVVDGRVVVQERLGGEEGHPGHDQEVGPRC